ncbi:hypothetical protein WT27_12890 [Burkholderia territorii]|uniref:Uncharacterized protein n=2 Tax=Burkholderia territorii TaxID=1503055 RepID=A0A125A9A9_9BURK|nr:hypothetical protein WT27_12890 [Burkholderia territorii]
MRFIMTHVLGQMTVGNEALHVLADEDQRGGGLAVRLIDSEGAVQATLSVNTPKYCEQLEDQRHTFIVKGWGDNEPLVEAAMRSGFFIDTGCSVEMSSVCAPVWRLARAA